jgi:ring-1,2-phenylacetyl-CoA epoxidase subunit PaaD
VVTSTPVSAQAADRPGSGRPGSGSGSAQPDAAPAASRVARARAIAAAVPDPELPQLTLADLGILREVRAEAGRIVVALTPTYSGCPALSEMRDDLARRLITAGFADVEIRTVLSPAWTTDWITAEGRRKLAAAGIAPPGPAPRRPASGPVPLTLTTGRPGLPCPVCGSADTALTAAFSATACKDLYRCQACAEPFEHVKEI